MEQAYSRWLTHVTEPELLEQLKNMSEQERQEAFCCELAFGTGGLRGILGAGTNRMNVYVIRRATQAVADYLNEGMTTKNHKASLRERFRIMSRHYGFLPALSLHAWFALRTFTKK